MRSGRWMSFAAAVIVGIGAAVSSAPPAAASSSDQLQDSTIVTYELVPARHVIHVTGVITMTNRKPTTTSSRSCTQWAFDPWTGWYQYTTTCTWRTSYYYFSSSFWIESDATRIKASASSGSVTPKAGKIDGKWRLLKLSYSRLYNGQTRKITFSYDLPASGPRGTLGRVASEARASFCASGPGSDSGEVRVVLPAGFIATFTPSMKLTSGAKGGKLVWTSGRLKQTPWTFRSCVDGDNPQGVTTTPVAPAGGPVAAVTAWKDDPTWSAAAIAAASDAARVASVLGAHPDGGGITIRETAASEAPIRVYDGARHILVFGENVIDPAAIDDEITRTWFPSQVFGNNWILGGYVRWAEFEAGVGGATCPSTAATTATPAPDLNIWPTIGATASPAARASAEAKVEAACSIMRALADAIGPERMRSTIAAMRDGLDAWSPDAAPAKRAGAQIYWGSWLDIVTERGLIPAGADPDLAAKLLLTGGVTTSKAEVDAHRAVRDAFAKVGALTGGKIPAPVGPALAADKLVTAQAALDAAARAWTTAAAVPTTLPGVVVDGGPVQQAVTSAASQSDLDAAVALADRQEDLAKDVADACAVEDAPRDTLQQIGLIGVTLPADATAIDAVSKVDAAAAGSTADAMRSAIGAARDTGTTRVAIAVGVVVVLVVVLVLVVVPRRRGRGTPAGGPGLALAAVAGAAAQAPVVPSSSPDPVEPPAATPPAPPAG